MTPMVGHRLGMAGGLAVLDGRRRVIGHEGAHTFLLGIVGQVSQLLVDHDQFLTQGAQARTGLDQFPLDRPLPHRQQCMDGQAVVPEVGLEPTRPFGQRILSPSRLPFRHSGE